MEDLKKEETARSLSEEEQAKHSCYTSYRRTSEDSEWMSKYITGHSKLCAQPFKILWLSSDHAHEAEQGELYIGQQRLRRLKRIRGNSRNDKRG